MNLKQIFLILLTIPLLASCGDDDVDTTKPTVVIESPADHATFVPGQTVNLAALLRDNVELSSWKVTIHFNADGHVHASGNSFLTKSSHGHSTGDWHYEATGIIPAGLKEFNLSSDIVIPAGTKTGEYHLGVFVTDKSGNENRVFIEIKVQLPI